MLGTQRATNLSRKTNLVRTIGMKIKLSPTIPLLLIQVKFRPKLSLKPLRKTNVIKKTIEVT